MLLSDSVRRETRLVRDIQIIYKDLLPLATSGNKIPGTTLDAFAAVIQNRTSDPNFCVFSSRLGPLVSGLVQENKVHGTVKTIAEAAVSLELINIQKNTRSVGGICLHFLHAPNGCSHYALQTKLHIGSWLGSILVAA